MASLKINDQNYFVEQYGKGDDLVMLHGFTGSILNWLPLLSDLSARFKVTLIDILGHGRSASPSNPDRYAITAVSTDLIAIFDHLDIRKAHLLGYSMGGRLALFTAVHHPQRLRSLILESSSPGLATATERIERISRDNSLADSIEANGIEAFVNLWESLPLWNSQAQLAEPIRQQLRQQRLINSLHGLANSLRGMGTGAQPSLWPWLPSLHFPTLQIVGALDQKFVAINQQMAQQLPNSQLTIIPDAGHTVHLERPSIFTQQVLPFLASSG